MAEFTRRRKYNRLVGRLSLLEIAFVYIPMIALNAYNLSIFKPSRQIFYVSLDSLLLVLYAMILITITMVSRERVLHIKYLLNIKELFKWDVSSDSETMYEFDPDDPTAIRLKVSQALQQKV
jgi:hypothetical protein